MALHMSFDGGSGAGKGTVIEWYRGYLSGCGKRTLVLKDNQIDPLRDLSTLMLPWCEQHKVNRNSFALPLFAAGAKLAEIRLTEALKRHDVVLRDRSFVSSLAYTPTSGDYDAEQVWSLYVDHMKIRVPDISVIVDADVDVAMARIEQRKQKDVGLGGKMSGDREHRLGIRKHFLTIPGLFEGRLQALVVENSDPFTDDPAVRQASVEKVGIRIIEFCKERGVLS